MYSKHMLVAHVVTNLHGPDNIDVVNQAMLLQYFVTSHSTMVYVTSLRQLIDLEVRAELTWELDLCLL